VGAVYYFVVQRGRTDTVLAEHRSDAVLTSAGVTDEPA
jgi:hypothetical protein